MKKRVFLFLVFMFVSAGFVCAQADTSVLAIYVDGKELAFDVEPVVVHGRAYVPIRPVLEAYTNTEVSYKTGRSGRIMKAETEDGEFSLDVDKGNYLYKEYFSGKSRIGVLQNKPFLKEGRTMLPVREIIELLGGEVNYDGELGVIVIHSEQYSEYDYLEGRPFPLVLMETDYDIELSKALSDMEGYEYYAELAEKLCEMEEKEEDGELAEDYSSYLREFCYSEIKYLSGYDLEEEYTDYCPEIIYNFLCEDYSEFLKTDGLLSDEESLVNLFNFIVNGEGESAEVNNAVLTYARYVLAYIDYNYDIDSLSEKISAGEFEGYNAPDVMWPYSPKFRSLDSSYLSHIEGFIERLYKNDKEILVIFDELRPLYFDTVQKDGPEYDEARKELYKSFFGDDWYYYFYDSDVKSTAYKRGEQ